MKMLLKKFCEDPKYESSWNVFYKLVQPVTRYSILSSTPWLWLWYAKHVKPPGVFWQVPGPHTELLIESPGSCASIAFAKYVRTHNPGRDLAYCCEVPATVKYCVKRGIPTIVLTRNAIDYVRSGTSRYTQISTANAFRTYCHFHRHILPLRDKFLLADFHKVRSDPQKVMEECNGFFGTSFNTGDNVLPKVRLCQYGL